MRDASLLYFLIADKAGEDRESRGVDGESADAQMVRAEVVDGARIGPEPAGRELLGEECLVEEAAARIDHDRVAVRAAFDFYVGGKAVRPRVAAAGESDVHLWSARVRHVIREAVDGAQTHAEIRVQRLLRAPIVAM